MASSFKESDEYDEELNSNSSTNKLLREKRDVDNDIPLCGVLSVRYYKPFFDIDTSDVLSRLLNALFFCRREQLFLTITAENPDAYGPVWIATTLVFIVAFTSHVNSWLTSWISGMKWQYDFQSVVNSASVVYGFAGCAPLAIWLLFRQMSAPVTMISMFCLYGYSLFVFIPASLFCMIPNEITSWIALIVAAVTSGLFLLRNLAPHIVAQAPQRAAPLLGLIGCIPLAFMLSLKLFLFAAVVKR